MITLCARLIPGLLLVSATVVAQAQTPPGAPKVPLAPGVSRAVEHPDRSPPDPTINQTLPDEHQPETAVDHERGAPETAVDHERGGPETARDEQKLVPETARDEQKLAPQTARDDQKLTPETAVDDQKLTPETASDAAKPSRSRLAAATARQGVRSNTPPATSPPAATNPQAATTAPADSAPPPKPQG
jgi:hypothetical protein